MMKKMILNNHSISVSI